MRRGIMAGACALLVPARAQEPPASGIGAFLAVSMKLTGRTHFDPLLAERVHAALVRHDADFAAKIAALDKWIATHGGTPTDIITAALEATRPELAKTVGSVMRAWYLGVVGEPPHVEVVAYERALMFDPVGDMLTVPSYCRGEPADWAKKP
ncbi:MULTISPECIES: sorbitol dehydrogenase family protein [Caballeronia]|uniref:sorbitol dehydrogenase family protein n=2 Tax=Burkholderiaceae TaxID=119060 RepID=UPI001F26D796|nr:MULTISPECIES: sorbitol dehydrogenase family protein [Caballeronia]MDR5769178.1 sorbitol dehydrogenase family protein [Caballeronia sp. LZ028]MDR5789598.1 sorbitol dehydrogenase family protein [Caballeronia sp. LP003]MDR5797929.1 sorbitol dehydrogenase family protein [Caballeronia sp. LZ008]